MFLGKSGGTQSHEQDDVALFHDEPGHRDGMGNVLHGRHRTCTEGLPFHHARIQFNLPGGIEDRSSAGIEGLVILHHHDGLVQRHLRRRSPVRRTAHPALSAFRSSLHGAPPRHRPESPMPLRGQRSEIMIRPYRSLNGKKIRNGLPECNIEKETVTQLTRRVTVALPLCGLGSRRHFSGECEQSELVQAYFHGVPRRTPPQDLLGKRIHNVLLDHPLERTGPVRRDHSRASRSSPSPRRSPRA